MNIKPIKKRMCIVTKEKKPANELFKVVRLPNGDIMFDKNHTFLGRSAYISKNLEVILKAQKTGALNKALRKKVDDSIYIELIQHLK